MDKKTSELMDQTPEAKNTPQELIAEAILEADKDAEITLGLGKSQMELYKIARELIVQKHLLKATIKFQNERMGKIQSQGNG